MEPACVRGVARVQAGFINGKRMSESSSIVASTGGGGDWAECRERTASKTRSSASVRSSSCGAVYAGRRHVTVRNARRGAGEKARLRQGGRCRAYTAPVGLIGTESG